MIGNKDKVRVLLTINNNADALTTIKQLKQINGYISIQFKYKDSV